jgi:DNA invertase Pin-like site-specific DNA recombinase
MGTDPDHLAGSSYAALADALFATMAESTRRLGRTVEANADTLAHFTANAARCEMAPGDAALDFRLRRFAAALLDAAQAFESRRIPSEETRAAIGEAMQP